MFAFASCSFSPCRLAFSSKSQHLPSSCSTDFNACARSSKAFFCRAFETDSSSSSSLRRCAAFDIWSVMAFFSSSNCDTSTAIASMRLWHLSLSAAAASKSICDKYRTWVSRSIFSCCNLLFWSSRGSKRLTVCCSSFCICDSRIRAISIMRSFSRRTSNSRFSAAKARRSFSSLLTFQSRPWSSFRPRSISSILSSMIAKTSSRTS
mmetsp:Transcript_48488/g.96498  ORF Transcript_48488/g.96498 Transcript_48488/m.96498 type:complete len:207 (-) Transcript_48488:304-924(-)